MIKRKSHAGMFVDSHAGMFVDSIGLTDNKTSLSNHLKEIS